MRNNGRSEGMDVDSGGVCWLEITACHRCKQYYRELLEKIYPPRLYIFTGGHSDLA